MVSIMQKIESLFSDDSPDPMSKLDSDMKLVLDTLAALKPKPIETLSAQEARRQPTPANAAREVMIKKGMDNSDDMGVHAVDTNYDGATGQLPIRIYRPEGNNDELPVILYFHGGGWVIADIDTYDAAPRAMAKEVKAVVLSAHYRQAPEHKFPAAHEDAYAAYRWAVSNVARFGGDARRIAIMGESAGGNLAIATAIKVRDSGAPSPVHVVAVYPVAGVNMNAESYQENENVKPLNKAMMQWFMNQVLTNETDRQDARLDLIGKANLSGLPPTTIVTADIDPLRSDGELLAEKMKAAHVKVNYANYEGVTHEFFGMGAVVGTAKTAESMVAEELKNAFSN